MNKQSVCGSLEVFVFDKPVRADIIKIDDACNPSARDDEMPRSFTASLANKKRLLINEEIRERVYVGISVGRQLEVINVVATEFFQPSELNMIVAR